MFLGNDGRSRDRRPGARTDRLGRIVEHQFEQSRAGDAIGEGVMNAYDHGAAVPAKPIDNVDFPKRLIAVQNLAEETPGERFQFFFRPRGRAASHDECVRGYRSAGTLPTLDIRD